MQVVNPEVDQDRRQLADRRERPTSPLAALPPAGQRTRARRADEHCRPYYVDRFSALMLGLIVAMLAASFADAVLTIHLLGIGWYEANPVMACLLEYGVSWFFVGKYLLTAVGLPVLLVFKNHYLFGTRFRVGYVIPAILVFYLVLIAHQLHWIAGL
mgnify:CR=1 FL=1